MQRRHRRAVGPPGAHSAQDEPRPEPVERDTATDDDDERLRRERPPHHEDRPDR